MKVEVTTPREYARAIEANLLRCRPQTQHTDERGETAVISAIVPLMNMFGYDANLRSMSHGRATFTMQFDHYAPAPLNVTNDDPSPFSPAIGMRA
jgi:elongation factor G